LVRIEDLDPPREVPGASSLILHQLEAFGFEWDGEVRYQSRRQDDYEAALTALQQQSHLFWCRCSRTDLAHLPNPAYPGTCRKFTLPRSDAAIRLRVPDSVTRFTDRLFGPQQESVGNTVGDFVLKRRDGLYAYQLAVVVDDADQGITQVVRGSDLLDNTARQILLQQMLGVPSPDYMHLPLIVNADGNKLSKQTYAKALPLTGCTTLLLQTLHHLRQKPPASLQTEQPSTVLAWAVANWQRHRIGMEPIPFAEG
jgi:glutamyl-Q tRNA(Asp) synthetase